MSNLEVTKLAADLADHVQDILLASNTAARSVLFDPESCMSDERMFEVAKYVYRDLGRLEKDQDGRVAISKIVGYIAFWFAKLKPLNSVFVVEVGGQQKENELCDINEQVAALLIERIFWDLVSVNENLYPHVWQSCPRAGCMFTKSGVTIKGKCFREKLRNYKSVFDRKHINYVIYCLRYRAIGPYFIVNYVDEALIFSCEHHNPPVT